MLSFLAGCGCPRSEPAGGHREWPDVVGQKWSGEGLPTNQQTTHPTDGRSGGTQRPGHHIRLVKTNLSF